MSLGQFKRDSFERRSPLDDVSLALFCSVLLANVVVATVVELVDADDEVAAAAAAVDVAEFVGDEDGSPLDFDG